LFAQSGGSDLSYSFSFASKMATSDPGSGPSYQVVSASSIVPSLRRGGPPQRIRL